MPNENELYCPDRASKGNLVQSPLRKKLPFGAVMATAGAAQLTPFCGLAPLRQPLLWTSVFEIVWIAVFGALRHRHESSTPIRSWLKIGPANEHVGAFTIPIGFAVVSNGLISLGGSVPRFLSIIFLIFAWLGSAISIFRFARSLTKVNAAVTGGWFLAPASLLATAIATSGYLSETRSELHGVLTVGIFVATSLGDLGYFLLIFISGSSIAQRGLKTSNRVLWWISSGCGGLNTASIGKSLVMSKYLNIASIEVLRISAVTSLLIATLLAIPILMVSLKWLLSHREISKTPPWPPTFSTAVFALGALTIGTMYHLQIAKSLGKGAAVMTVVLWTVTAALNVSGTVLSLGKTPSNLA